MYPAEGTSSNRHQSGVSTIPQPHLSSIRLGYTSSASSRVSWSVPTFLNLAATSNVSRTVRSPFFGAREGRGNRALLLSRYGLVTCPFQVRLCCKSCPVYSTPRLVGCFAFTSTFFHFLFPLDSRMCLHLLHKVTILHIWVTRQSDRVKPRVGWQKHGDYSHR